MTRKQKACDDGYFFKIQCLEVMHPFNMHLSILKYFLKLAMHAFQNAPLPFFNGTEKNFGSQWPSDSPNSISS